MLLLIDNYDSFAHNLARYIERLGVPVVVRRNDAIDPAGVRALRPAAVVLSPGPCTPNEAGASLDIVRQLHEEFPMLGVCLGHQVIAQALGGRVVASPTPVHGRSSAISHTGTGLFSELPTPLDVGRYHSLIVPADSLPAGMRATAWTADGVLMAFDHERLPLFGVQFHPESILTQNGYQMLANFLRLSGIDVTHDAEQLSASERREPIRNVRPLPRQPVTF